MIVFLRLGVYFKEKTRKGNSKDFCFHRKYKNKETKYKFQDFIAEQFSKRFILLKELFISKIIKEKKTFTKIELQIFKCSNTDKLFFYFFF